jgi:hypothetical protein
MDEQICRQRYFRRFFAGKCADFAMLFTDWPALFADLRTGFSESSCSKRSTLSLGTLKISAASETEGNGVVMMAFGTSVSFMLKQFQTPSTFSKAAGARRRSGAYESDAADGHESKCLVDS